MDKRVRLTFVLVLTLGLPACASGGAPVKEEAAPTAAKSVKPTAEPAKTNKPEQSGVCAEKSNGQTCAFGQAAAFTVTAGSGPNLSIQITVAPPVPFTPTDPLEVEAATQDENINFLVTLKNLSGTEWENVLILTDAVSAGVAGSEIYSSFNGVDVPPGGSVQVREAWSVKDASDVELTLDLEGLAGHSIAFTR